MADKTGKRTSIYILKFLVFLLGACASTQHPAPRRSLEPGRPDSPHGRLMIGIGLAKRLFGFCSSPNKIWGCPSPKTYSDFYLILRKEYLQNHVSMEFASKLTDNNFYFFCGVPRSG